MGKLYAIEQEIDRHLSRLDAQDQLHAKVERETESVWEDLAGDRDTFAKLIAELDSKRYLDAIADLLHMVMFEEKEQYCDEILGEIKSVIEDELEDEIYLIAEKRLEK